MTEILVVVAILAAVIALSYMWVFGWDRVLESGIRSQIQPDETVVFKSRATKSSLSFPAAFLGPRQGLVAVTNRRIILSFWKTFLPVRKVEDITISELEDVSVFQIFGMSQIYLTLGRPSKVFIMLTPNRFWPFSKQLGPRFVEALQNGEGARFTVTTSSGFKNMIRSQIERKR